MPAAPDNCPGEQSQDGLVASSQKEKNGRSEIAALDPQFSHHFVSRALNIANMRSVTQKPPPHSLWPRQLLRRLTLEEWWPSPPRASEHLARQCRRWHWRPTSGGCGVSVDFVNDFETRKAGQRKDKQSGNQLVIVIQPPARAWLRLRWKTSSTGSDNAAARDDLVFQRKLKLAFVTDQGSRPVGFDRTGSWHRGEVLLRSPWDPALSHHRYPRRGRASQFTVAAAFSCCIDNDRPGLELRHHRCRDQARSWLARHLRCSHNQVGLLQMGQKPSAQSRHAVLIELFGIATASSADSLKSTSMNFAPRLWTSSAALGAHQRH